MKRTILLLFTLLLFSFGIESVSAKEQYRFANGDIQYLKKCTNNTSKSNDTCTALLGDPECEGHFAYYLQLGLDVIKYLGIILCIFLTIVDFAKALFSDDKDLIKPLSKKAMARLVYAVLLFLLPSIVRGLLTLIDVYGTCGIS